jgi:DNA-nicking Smr family endonuclease
MGKRQTSRRQRRRGAKDGKPPLHPKPGQSRPAGITGFEPRSTPSRSYAERHLPEEQEESFASIVGRNEGQESFAELLENFLAAPAAQEALQEKRQQTLSRQIAKPREYPVPQAELDLHRHTGPEALRGIENFIQTARGRGLVSLRIITGKGLHSGGPAVLREVAEGKLLELKERRLVTAYRWEHGQKEKSGSLIVYLEN